MYAAHSPFLNQINRVSRQQVQTCYHCHTCTAGCPLAADMHYGPDRIIRLIERNERWRTLSTPDIWLCAGCNTCTARCPNGIDVARVMDALRQVSLAEGVRSPEPGIILFHRLYMRVVRDLGRSNEALLLALFKLLRRDLFSDLKAGFWLVLKGKIPLRPNRLPQAGVVRKIFEAAAAADAAEVTNKGQR